MKTKQNGSKAREGNVYRIVGSGPEWVARIRPVEPSTGPAWEILTYRPDDPYSSHTCCYVFATRESALAELRESAEAIGGRIVGVS